ncbi:hypothetical protein [Altererythrobacter sp. MTPC7]|uniref:hypothetical protein n=1 Tax=Altererythrobacter sp. MTPC7 TaxID=3056567 RepID=UPI0036F37D07
MDSDLAMIFAFVLLVLMFVMPMAYVFQKRAAEHEERKLELEARKAEAKNGHGGASYRKLEERVRVLERIATDSNDALASQIDELRNLQAIDDRTERENVS